MNLTELLKVHGFHPKGILHIGASMLEEAEAYTALVGDNVIWVEALPPDKDRQARAEAFGHTLFEACPLSDRVESITLRVAKNLVSTSILPFKRHLALYPDINVIQEIPATSVLGRDIVGFPRLATIDTLVIDVQGAELKVLKGLGEVLNHMKVCWLEVNEKELYEGCVLKPELDAFMKAQGFQHVEYFPVHLEEWGEALYRR